MTSTRPYLIRAFYDWIVDNNCTPHIVVNASGDHVEVPREYVDNGQIVLNVSISAVQGLLLGDEAIEFQARFGGRIFKVYAPVSSILAIYAKENGRGMVFAEEEIAAEDEELQGSLEQPAKPVASSSPLITAVETDDKKDGDNGGTDKGGNDKGGKGNRSHLTLVKK